MPERDARLRLPDGRILSYAQYGAPAGPGVFAFHGTPGTRLMFAVADAPARAQGLRLIALDRPGYGDSTYQPDRTLAGYPDEVARLADHLELARFGLLGISAGGYHAGLVAASMPERIRATAMVSPYLPGCALGGWQRLFMHAARTQPALLRLLSGGIAWAERNLPRLAYRLLELRLNDADRAIMHDHGKWEGMERSMHRACMDLRGFNQEVRLLARAAAPPRIKRAGPVKIWHGLEDRVVLPQTALLWTAVFPDAELELIPGAGHFWAVAGMLEVLERLRSMMEPCDN